MIRIPNDFKEFLRLLQEHEVAHLLVGGYAVGYYGHPRATGDMDIWVKPHPDNAPRIVAALKDFGFDAPNLRASLFLERERIVRMGVPPLRLEVMTDIDGVDFDSCFSRRERAEIDGMRIDVISLVDLRRNKLASGRHKDLADLEQLPE